MITEKQVIDFLKTKSKQYIDHFIESVLLYSNCNDDASTRICPRCGSSSVKKNGKNSNGRQRYYCHDCCHSFNERTGTLLHCSHMTGEQWKRFIDLEVSKVTLADEAHFLNVSKTTCFFMRHKLYSAVTEIISQQLLSGSIELDTEYLKINLKGTKPKNMPRISKKRGNSSAFRGISHHKISVVCAVDSNDHMIMKVTGLGAESFDKYKKTENYFKDVIKIISDSKTSIQQFANLLNAKNDKIPTSPLKKRYLSNEGESIATVNEMMTEVSGIITRTRGFSTRYAQGYLDFNILRKQMRYQHDRKEIAEKLFIKVIHTKAFINNNILKTPMPISLKEAYYEYRYGIFA